MNTITKGNRYKYKTKKWLENQGFKVEYSEMVRYYFDKNKNRMIPIKKDLFFSDIIAVRSDLVAFVQVKVNRRNLSPAKALLGALAVPKNVEKWIVVWTPMKNEPDIIKIAP